MDLKRWAKRLACTALLVGAVVVGIGQNNAVTASDHDDGYTNIKTKNTNLTDLFVFREDYHSGNAAHQGNLIFIMGTNPRSMPRQNYYFNPNALYNFHVTRNTNNDGAVSGREDIRFEFLFGPPDTNGQQSIRLVVHQVANGVPVTSETLTATTPRTTPAQPLLAGNTAVTNTFTAASGATIDVFAGLREDPFFFDVNAYFKVRAALRGSAGPTDSDVAGKANAFSPDVARAVDFTKDHNINAVVMRVPISFLQSAANETSFDVWETITQSTTVTQHQ